MDLKVMISEHHEPQGPGLGGISCPNVLLALVCGRRTKENLEMHSRVNISKLINPC